MTSILQRLVLPDLMMVNAPELYFRGDYLIEAGPRIFVKPYSKIRSNTYFNAFSLWSWAAKTKVRAAAVSVTIEQGKGQIVCFHHSTAGLTRLHEPIDFECDAPRTFEVSFAIGEFSQGIVYWEVRALTEVVLLDAHYVTQTPAERDVSLAVVVTTFKREAEVQQTIARFSSSRLPRAGHQLLVIDNGRTLELQTFAGGRVIPNENLGGAGGFSRGLLEAKDGGAHTHALFMDDDAATHMECIERASAFLSFARSPKLAISGAMLLRERPWIQFEAGAQMRRFGTLALKRGRDMRDLSNVIVNEDGGRIDYGAWWFFAFSIAEVRNYAFPFFVRGDDIQFSLAHEFHIIAPTGVAIWQPVFEDKITPSSEYLAHRADFAIALLHNRGRIGSLLSITKRAAMVVLREAACFRYGIADARCEAMEDVLLGPDFWRNNPSALPRLAAIKARYRDFYPVERSDQIVAGARVYRPSKREGGLHRALRHLTLNGHLIPEPFLRRRARVVPGLAASPRAAFLRRRLIYASETSLMVLVTERSPRAFFRIFARVFRLYLRMARHGVRVARDYRLAGPDIMSDSHWRSLLQLAPVGADEAPSGSRGSTAFSETASVRAKEEV